ncbi:MAG: efflux RND transporter periplasmic adaptor subunit [Nitrospira sp.]|nr:efflux RND transporter periplasmic adaptor subunit [Nitrospira sp.]
MKQRIGLTAGMVGLLAAVLSLGVVTGCSREQEGSKDSHATPAAESAGIVRLKPEAAAAAGIEVSPVVRGEFRMHRDFPGTVQPNKNKLAEVTTLVRGRAVDVYVDVGQDVKGGDLLARLYSSELGLAQSSYLKANAKLREAELVFERARDLFRDKAVSQAEFQKREAELQSQRAEAREARDRLMLLGMHDEDIQRLDREQTISSYVPIQAPFAGRVIARNLAKGEVVETSHELFTVADLADVWVIANAPEKDVRFIRRDQVVEVLLPAYPHETFHGKISYVGDVLDPATRTMKARVVVLNPDRRLKPEMFATVRVYADPEAALMIPAGAVQRDRGEAVVFVQLDPQQFERRPVKLGEESRELVKVLDGLQENDRVVTKGAFVLKSEALEHQLEPAR